MHCSKAAARPPDGLTLLPPAAGAGKFGGLVLTIPHCVLGGATSFLFAAVVMSGVKILMMGDALTRRNRFIISCALAFGLGVTMVPQW